MPQGTLAPGNGFNLNPAATQISIWHAAPTPGGPAPVASNYRLTFGGQNGPVAIPIKETVSLPANATQATPFNRPVAAGGHGRVWRISNQATNGQSIVVWTDH